MDRYEMQQHASDTVGFLPGRAVAVYRPDGFTKQDNPLVSAQLTVLVDGGGIAASGEQPLHGRGAPSRRGPLVRRAQITIAIQDFTTMWDTLWTTIPTAQRPEHKPHQPRDGDTFCVLNKAGVETDEVWRVTGTAGQVDHGGFLVLEAEGGVGSSR